MITIGLILTLLALSISVSAQEGDSCKLPVVKVGFTASMCSHNPYTISLNGTQVTGTGDCTAEQWVTSALTYTELKVDQTYTLTVGADSCSTHVNFTVPEGYKLEIDGVEAKSIDKVGTTEGGGDGSWNVVLRQKCPCGNEGPGESTGPKKGSVLWQVGMGTLSNGITAHSINLREESLSAVVYTPAALIYSPPGRTNEVDVVRNGDQSLRQVKAPQTFADIVVISATEYEVRYYRPADVGAKVAGLYPVTGQPFVTWRIKNPDPSSTTRLQISKIQGAVTDMSEYTWDAISDSWTLSTGNGARIETSTITYPTQTSRVETIVVKDTNLLTISKVSRTYHTFAWGEELIQEVLDPDGAALKTVYSYYENQSETGRYTRRVSVVNPDGSWEKYDYDSAGNTVLVLRPWKDQSIGAATEENSYAIRYTYSNSDGIITSLYTNLLSSVTEKIGGVIVRKRTYSRTGTTVDGNPAVVETETSYSSASESLVTTSTHYHATAPVSLANRMISVEYPDGRKVILSYEKGNYVPNADAALSTFTPDVNGLAERQTMVQGTIVSPLGIAFKTTKETSIRDQYGNQVLRETYVYTGADYERIAWSSMDYDGRGHVVMSRNHKGDITTAVWTGDQKTSETDASGIETTYSYDSLNRVQTKTKKGIAASGGFPAQADIVTTFSYDAEGRQMSEVVKGGSLSLSTSRVYDLVGRIVRETDQAGLNTTYLYSNGGRTQTMTLPGGASEISDNYLDGQPKSVTGSAVVARYFDYGVNADGTQYAREFVGPTGSSSPRWTKTTSDWISRPVSVEKPTFTGTNIVETSMYNTLSQLQKRTTMAGTTKLLADRFFEYNELGQQVRVGSDIDANGTLSLASTDRINETDSVYEKVGNDWFLVTTNRTYVTDNNSTPTIQSQRQRLNNFALNGTDQTISVTTVTNEAGSTTTTITTDRVAKKQVAVVDTPDSNINGISITINGLLQSSSPTTPQPATTYLYDPLARPISVTDPQTGTTTLSYSPSTGRVTSINDGIGEMLFEYYPGSQLSAGRLRNQTNAAGKKTYFNYNSRGEMVQTWGDATYPVANVYDSYGQRIELHTFRGGQNWTSSTWPSSTAGTADVTKWSYQEVTGLLIQKQDASLKGPAFTYDELGRVKTRAWARGVTCTYAYDENTGELRTITYSDSTPAISITYDRGGRQIGINDAAGSRSRTFNVAGDLQTEQITGGLLDGVAIAVGYDEFLRRNSLQAFRGANTLSSQTYSYDSNSRLQTIASGSQTATYAYYPTTGLLNTTTFTGGTSNARTYDTLGRLQSITTTPASDVAQSYTYTYNNLNQRTRVTREDGSYWSYIYNDRGELVSGKKYWPDNSIVWGAQTEYGFDTSGNRTLAKNGGNQLGNLRESYYTTNSRNQYSQRTVPGAVDLTGTANSAATVVANNQSTIRKNEYFYRELLVDNTAGPVYPQINIVGARNNFGAGGEDAVNEKGGRALLPSNVESFNYDDDGNLVSDGRWNYSWDGENRLIIMETPASVPAEARKRLEFSYDWGGRRIQKKVFLWNDSSTTFELQSTTKFVYNRRNLIAELDAGNNLFRNAIWGAIELLWVNAGGNTYMAGYDGNENVGSLISASDGKIHASYDYNPFGEELKEVGQYADQNPFRFSGQYADTETGFSYYGYRFYNSQTGRWLSRDPAQEEGGLNLYRFIDNDGVNGVDHLGLWRRDTWTGGWYDYKGHATAEKCDRLSELARLITGDENDWKYLNHSEQVREGEVIDITPLLEIMETRIRTSVRRASSAFNAQGFPRCYDGSCKESATPWLTTGSSQAAEIAKFFTGKKYGWVGCDAAATLIQSQGLINVIGDTLYDQVLTTKLGNDPLAFFHDRWGKVGTMLEGDGGWLPNYDDYQGLPNPGDYGHENSIKIGQDVFYGHPLGRFNLRTLERTLQEEYVRAGGNRRRDPIPGLHNRENVKITFIDVAKVFGYIFDIRRN
ncbi:MAG TPA: RHS repeat-associated core domain-containing protein [Pyrinomonadaceae bacterium]|nr:RHS repeat-associated core domain-containing protein [Pyrinomonadaceae bacterium]